MRFILSIILFILLNILTVDNTKAQSLNLVIHPDEMIVYNQTIDGQRQLVIRYLDRVFYFVPPPDKCSVTSPDWRYYTVFETGGNKIQIFHLQTNKLVAENNWDGLVFNRCNHAWYEDNTISVLQSIQPYERYLFYFDGFTIVQLEDYTFPTVTLPPLPNSIAYDENFPNLENYVWSSPDPNIYLYEACPTIETSSSLYCEGGTELIIYDTAQNQVIENISEQYPRLDKRYLRGDLIFRFNRNEPISEVLVAWSYDARYVAFCDCTDNNNGFIISPTIIYDRYTDTYHNPTVGFQSNIWRKFSWSSNANILALWSIGFGAELELYPYLPHDALNRLAFVHMDTSANEVISEASFDIISERVVWSPDNRAVAFHGKERVNPAEPYSYLNNVLADLILMDTLTGEHLVIDENVTQVYMWRSICDFTVSDSTSLISTMQTEPYSVICLDENATYTLTAPLPTITGDITVIGNGAQIVMRGAGRVFDVASTGGLTLKNITVSGGNAVQGGAIYNAGEVTLENVVLENNSATDGGAIYNVGNLEMDGGAIQNNTATNFGGGIYNLGELDVDGVNIRDNDASEGSGVYQGE